MRPRNHESLLTVIVAVLLFATFSFYTYFNFITVTTHSNDIPPLKHPSIHKTPHHVIPDAIPLRFRPSPPEDFNSDSILLPDWEVLVLSSPGSITTPDSLNQYSCHFQNNAISPAKFTGVLRNSGISTFKCGIPNSVRRLRFKLSPILTMSRATFPENQPEMIRWNFVSYESLTTETDVILFVKGVNNRQGVNRSPEELSCVFSNGAVNVKTAVISSAQEVIRCKHPTEAEVEELFLSDERVKISVEIGEESGSFMVPSVTYYGGKKGNVEEEEGKSVLCASTMVHNVGKFLKEWVVYNTKIGVEKFILYDNDSEDDLKQVVGKLVDDDQYNVEVLPWPWPKTQEAGFSHSAIYAKDSCSWMLYVDVDEFVFSPSWLNASYPSHDMLSSLVPKDPPPSSLPLPETATWLSRPIGQVSVRCLEFGPSNQKTHPIAGVTQGYTCRRRLENRHKSILLLDAVDYTLHNAIHHFQLKDGYKSKTLSLDEGVVNHYKYQAWSEFKEKFRRRVSAYVVDWKQALNPMSKDRTPGLGYEAIEPEGWPTKFCEVNDSRVKMATQRWFGVDSSTESKLVWQD